MGTFPDDIIRKGRVSTLINYFKNRNYKPFYKGKLCVPRTIVKDMMLMAHDCKISGHLSFQKTLHRLSKSQRKYKTIDLNA